MIVDSQATVAQSSLSKPSRIILIPGNKVISNHDDYWAPKSDTHKQKINTVMSQNRKQPKLYQLVKCKKMLPLANHLNQNFVPNFDPEMSPCFMICL